jgi:hypothetical protein
MIGNPARARMTATVGALLCLVFVAAVSAAQSSAAGSDALRDQIERRFTVQILLNGIELVPKSRVPDVPSIELTDDTIAVGGTAVSGGELRKMLGADAELVLRLSYLDAAKRRALLEPTPSAAPVAPPPPEVKAPERPERKERLRSMSRRHGGARMRIGGFVVVGPDETAEDVVVIGGTADIQGRVEGDVVLIGGSLTLGPHAEVTRDVTLIGGVMNRDPGAQIVGKVNEVGAGDFDLRGLRWPRIVGSPLLLFGGATWSLFALFWTTARFVVLSVLASLVVLFAHEHVERIGARASADPVKAGLIGFCAELVLLPLLILTIIVLVVTIIGIPLLALLPFAILAIGVLFLVGFTAVAYNLGRLVSARFGWSLPNPYATAIVGILVVMAPLFLARLAGLAGGLLFPITAVLVTIGVLIEYAAWTVGFGAVALTRFQKPAQTS